MSSGKKDDLTRIEDLGDFFHEETETPDEIDDSDEFAAGAQDIGYGDGFLDQATDPNIELPDEFLNSSENTFESNSDFTDSENETDSDAEEFSDHFEAFQPEDEDAFQVEDEENQDTFLEAEASDSSSDEELFSDSFESEEAVPAIEMEIENPEEEILAVQDDYSPIEEATLPDTQKTPIIRTPVTESPIDSSQTLEEIKSFAKHMALGNMAQEGNPPYSIIVKDLVYLEDIDPICELLLDYKIITSERLNDTQAALKRGALLVPRLSEYVAIMLCHKLRQYSACLMMGLSDEIHPQTNKEATKDLATRAGLYNQRQHHLEFQNGPVSIKDIITATTNSLEGHEISQYLGIVTDKTIVDIEDYGQDFDLESELINSSAQNYKSHLNKNQVIRMNKKAAMSELTPLGRDQGDDTQYHRYNLNDIYHHLINQLKGHAKAMNGNAIVGINFTVTPLSVQLQNQGRFHITCTGNVVWANKR